MKSKAGEGSGGLVKTWNERLAEVDFTDKPLAGALLERAAAELGNVENKYGFPVSPYDTIREMMEMAVAADIFGLLYPSLISGEEPDAPAAGSLPRDRILAFVCGIWFLTAVIPRLEEEGYAMDIYRLASQLGLFLFMSYGEENIPGLIKIGIQYWKEIGSRAPAELLEWHKAFSQMIFIHYEVLAGKGIDLGDFDLDTSIGKMLTVFLTAGFAPPTPQQES